MGGICGGRRKERCRDEHDRSTLHIAMGPNDLCTYRYIIDIAYKDSTMRHIK
jgi:hypothetical protein